MPTNCSSKSFPAKWSQEAPHVLFDVETRQDLVASKLIPLVTVLDKALRKQCVFVPSSYLLLVVRPGAPSSVFAPSSVVWMLQDVDVQDFAKGRPIRDQGTCGERSWFLVSTCIPIICVPMWS